MATKEVEERLRADANQINEYLKENSAERAASVLKRIERIEEEKRKNGGSN